MKSKIKIIGLLILVMFLFSCASIQESWNKLTPQEKSRIILNDMQEHLGSLFDTGKSYVVLHPEYQNKWKNDIIPAFSVTNRALASAIMLSKIGTTSPDEVYAQIQPLINTVSSLLFSIGAVK